LRPVRVRRLVVALRSELTLLRHRRKLTHDVVRVGAIGSDELPRLPRATNEAFVAGDLAGGVVAARSHPGDAPHSSGGETITRRTSIARRGEPPGARGEA
jgi:hypothetical protein